MKTRKALLMTATLLTALGATDAFAGHDRRVVIHETHYPAPVVTYHSGPVSVYVGPSHSTRVISTSHRTQSYGHDSYGHRSPGYSRLAPYGKAYGYQGRKHKDSYRNKYKGGQRHYGGHERGFYGSPGGSYYGGHASTRGSWSRDRREVIYVNRNARKSSNYRHVERNSVVIRERRR